MRPVEMGTGQGVLGQGRGGLTWHTKTKAWRPDQRGHLPKLSTNSRMRSVPKVSGEAACSFFTISLTCGEQRAGGAPA